MSTVLNLEREAEMDDLWCEGEWQLTPAEVRQLMALRVEFSEKAIAQVSLAAAGQR